MIDTLTPEQQRKLDQINKMPLTIEKDMNPLDPEGTTQYFYSF